ncbi:MAG: hypothetical protein MR872_03400, partial [Clostridium sp.]|nr:hypothetical protein [Clostridium sp.]
MLNDDLCFGDIGIDSFRIAVNNDLLLKLYPVRSVCCAQYALEYVKPIGTVVLVLAPLADPLLIELPCSFSFFGISHEISLSSGCTLIILHAEHAEINRLFHLACLLKQIEQRTDCKLP